MNIPYCGLIVNVEIRSIIEITWLELRQELNCHGKLSITCLVDSDRLEELFIDTFAEMKIKLCCGEKSIFYGYLSFSDIYEDRGQWMVTLKFRSETGKMDLCKKSRVFSEQNDSYLDVIEKVLENYPGVPVWDEITKERSIPGLLVQYEETDWEFLIRLASHFSSFLVAVTTNEKAGVYFGIPELDSHAILNERDYVIVQDKEYDKKNVLSHDQMFDQWKINSSRYLTIGDRVLFHGISTIVISVNIFERNGELIKEYLLQQKEGVKAERKYNYEILGLSLPATVIDRKENKVQVEFDVNQSYPREASSKFFVYGIESSSFYCIPEKGSRVHIYFPGRFEADAMAVHALNIGAGESRNPSTKTFSAPSGSAMNMTPNHYNFKSDWSEAAVLNLGADGTISLAGKNVTIEALNLIGLGTGEDGNTPEIIVSAKTEQVFSVAGPDSSITIGSDTKVVSELIKMKAENGDLSADAAAVRDQLTAGDDKLLEDYNKKQREKLNKINQARKTPSVEEVSDIAAEESGNEEVYGEWLIGYRDSEENKRYINGSLLTGDKDDNVDFSTPAPKYWGTDGNTKEERDTEIEDAVGNYQGLVNVGIKGRYDAAFRHDKYDYGETKVHFGSAYAGANFSVGSFQKGDAKWYELWKLEGVGVGGAAKAGVSAVDAEGTLRLLGMDNEVVNLNVGGRVSALKAEANLDVGLGMVDGKFKLGAEAGIGAYAVEGEVSAGVTLVGVDVNAKASGKIGFGAEAKVGYVDGKIKAKVGAAVFIGASVELEIDISDIQKGWDQVCGWWDSLW